MAQAQIVLLVALSCAAVIGFAAHRASLCHVRAVAEIMGSGSAHMLSSLLQAAIWMSLLSGTLTLMLGWTPQPVLMPAGLGWAAAGGALFGIGAALNGGCSLSTLHRLAEGELGMVATLLGFCAGVLLWVQAGGPAQAGPLQAVVPVWQRWPGLAPWLLAAMVLWALWRMRAFWHLAARARTPGIAGKIFAPSYPLGVSAALMGLAGGALFALQGAWSYTNHLRTSVLHATHDGAAPAGVHTALVIALVTGMLVSAFERGRRRWRWRWPDGVSAWIRHSGGGALMGAGAAMVPGGNDTLLLNALPTLAAQAIAAYVSMLVAIAGVLSLMQRVRGPMSQVRCTPEGCQEGIGLAANATTGGDQR